VAKRSDDTAFARTMRIQIIMTLRPHHSSFVIRHSSFVINLNRHESSSPNPATANQPTRKS